MTFLASRLLVAAVAVLVTLLLLSTPSTATLQTFLQQYQAIMESAGPGFGAFFDDAVSLPTTYVWSCQNATGTGATVAYASATAPYQLTVSTVALTVRPVTPSPTVTYELHGHSCDFYGSCGPIQIGTAPAFDAAPNHVIMVVGKMTSNGVVNFLPMAYYVVLPIASCSSSGSAAVDTVFRSDGTVTL
ncbi:hypothetical protein ABB37_07222 [Leptomonas pyrrhocoris]|uniref:Uncharacterized protein n=1 Tax=Leptomonas pyrrhocoris TaxID=157538 RepID=A0A0N0DTE5_LEPPY|nr:hypothetical protein ABB37_07222 [Leptomonas pyrrhocoris]KPA77341.1 hypothetical protein ABB37_07222 [Leptomonas pyrrhocoris]|eukprot:XP_015655780.1 hypothetical protein ABB37_07222 [Leptomonas pyrrhocoris]